MAENFARAGRLLVDDLARALESGAEEIMTVADVLVPKDTETLRESARILPAANDGLTVTVEMGYGFGGAVNPKTGNRVDEYAVPVHEIVEAHHAPPTQAKYLEQPALAFASFMEKYLAAHIKAQREGNV